MKLILDEMQQDLQKIVRQLVSETSGSEDVRLVMDSDLGYDQQLWNQLGELGLLGLVTPEDLGGAGAGHRERCVVLEELGRGLVPAPFLASAVQATDALLAIGDNDASRRYLPDMAQGVLIASIAVAEAEESWPTTGGATVASVDGESWRLSGRKTRVLSGDVARLFLVYAATQDGPAWFAVEGEAPGLTRRLQVSLDPTRRLARVDFDQVPARRLEASDAAAALEQVRRLSAVAVASEQVGGHERALTMTVDYAKVRVQFGRLIGSYQAVKHGLVDAYCDLELSQSLVRFAAWAADESPEELPTAAAAAEVFVGKAYFDAAGAAIQYHGGIGFTWEHDAHLYFKRAKSTQLLNGSTAEHQSRLADALAI